MDASGGADPAQVAAGTVGLPATEIARLVRSGEVTAVSVVQAHLDHIEAVDARIGAFRVLRRGAALAEAHAIDTALTRLSPGCARPARSSWASPACPSCASTGRPTGPAPSAAIPGTPRSPREAA